MKRKETTKQVITIILLSLLSLLIILPFWLVVSVSFSNEKDIMYYGYKVFPMHWDLSAYKYILKNPATILQAYKITAVYSFAAMALTTFMTLCMAYPLTRQYCRGRKFINFMLYLTMIFSGGMVPTYILNTQYLHLGNSIWIYILPGMTNVWYAFMIRTFISQLPAGLIESAEIDGANEFTILLRIVVPLCKPVLATTALFTFLTKWNDWFTSMLYIENQSLISLQYFLQRIMSNIQAMQEASTTQSAVSVGMKDIPSETVRMAMAVLVAGPALFVFPFFQKYFVKGMTVGSVKG